MITMCSLIACGQPLSLSDWLSLAHPYNERHGYTVDRAAATIRTNTDPHQEVPRINPAVWRVVLLGWNAAMEPKIIFPASNINPLRRAQPGPGHLECSQGTPLESTE
jgi:hypothetical protein